MIGVLSQTILHTAPWQTVEFDYINKQYKSLNWLLLKAVSIVGISTISSL